MGIPVTALLPLHHHHHQLTTTTHIVGHRQPPPATQFVEHEDEDGEVVMLMPWDKTCCAHQLVLLTGPTTTTTTLPPPPPSPPHPPRFSTPRPSMATVAYSHNARSTLAGLPDSPPELTNSKSSKASSLHSSALSDLMMPPTDLSHFEDINLDEASARQLSFALPVGPSHRLLFEAPKTSSSGSRSPLQPHFRPLTSAPTSKSPALKSHPHPAGQRQYHAQQLAAPANPIRRGFASSSAPSLTSTTLSAPLRSPRSQSPSTPHTYCSSPRSLSRSSSRALDVLPSPVLSSGRPSWQDARRKTVKEKEAECDDEDDNDELPEDAVIWNIPISPRLPSDRSPAASLSGSPPSVSPALGAQEASCSKPCPPPFLSPANSPAQSPDAPKRESFSSGPPTRQRTGAWEETYTALDADAKKLTQALEAFRSESERKQDLSRRQSGRIRSASLTRAECKPNRHALPPIRKSDPLIDPFQPSAEKQKYLSRTRPSWLPPKNPREEKKHLREYQRMLARIEEAERLEAERARDEAVEREKASHFKAQFWSDTLLPQWATEMANPSRRALHRKMWWDGIPPRLRGQVWQKALGNELEINEATYDIALEKARCEIKQHGQHALGGRYHRLVQATNTVFPELNMFGADTTTEGQDEQPLHQDLVDVCLAYAMYRLDISHLGTHLVPIVALLLLNLPAPRAFVVLSNLLNRPLPLSFLVHDENAIHAAYVTTLDALARKSHSLALRLEMLRVEPRDYLYSTFSSLFCGRLGVEHAARIMDVYLMEGDKTLPRAAVAIMLILEGSCVQGDVHDVARTLREKSITMDVEEFMTRVYEAGKSNR